MHRHRGTRDGACAVRQHLEETEVLLQESVAGIWVAGSWGLCTVADAMPDCLQGGRSCRHLDCVVQ